MKKIILVAILILILAAVTVFFIARGGFNFGGASDSDADFLKASEGFKISVFASKLEGPRVIAFDTAGRMVVSETEAGRIILLEDKDGDGKADNPQILLAGLNKPHGIDFYKDEKSGKNYIYIAEAQQVARYEYDTTAGKIISAGQNIASFKGPEGLNYTRTIAFGPDLRETPLLKKSGSEQIPLLKGTTSKIKLYISVGSSCDACLENSWKRGAMLESDPEGNYTAEFAGGLRNSVFFTFHPETGKIWATEIGRGGLGDNLPPDEINIVEADKKYGWPFCYGGRIRDKSFNPEKIDRTDIPTDCSKTEVPVIEIPAHVTPLGLAFITSEKWPPEWRGNLLVALHGSKDGSQPVGYKIVRYHFDAEGKISGPFDFVGGWLAGNKIYGRPVDLKFDKNGNLFVTDDSAGAIYKISRQGN